jgi:hypothetical protein
MADGLDEAANAFAAEVAPQSRPRDQGGKFVATTSRPEPMFGAREIEGDPLTGDTRDGGDNERLRAIERDVADGRSERPPQRRPEPDDTEVEDVEQDPENLAAADDDEPDAEIEAADDGSKYEVTVDGATHEVTLTEALNGYIRQATFHQRMAHLENARKGLEEDAARQAQGWQIWNKARADYEEDLANLIPKEPNWDELFARDPAYAYGQRKIFETLWGKLNASRQLRAQREQANREEADRRTHKYAVDGFSKFVMDNVKSLPDEPTLKKNIQSMRRTAVAAGFSEYEVATVYDPRMLSILLKASKYDRMQAARPRAVDPSKGRTLTPGAATPFGNARRNGLDDAQRRLASSGKMEDAVNVFRRML